MKKTLMIITTMILSSSLWAKPDCTPVEMLTGTISNMTLDASKLYRVSGDVSVTGTFTVFAGTVITFDDGDNLYFKEGSYPDIQGTELEPVIFTSIGAPGSKLPKVNAGVYFSGEAQLNEASLLLPNGNFHVSGNNPNHKSGHFEHVRFEFLSGHPDLGDMRNMDNGVTFMGMGNQTVFKNVQVSNSANNGLAIFGGEADMEQLFLLDNYKNNMFIAYGNTSSMSQIIAINKDPLATHIDGTNGVVIWNNDFEDHEEYTPLTKPIIRNSSLIGLGHCGGTKIGNGIMFDYNGGVHFSDNVITGYANGLFIQDELSAERTQFGTLIVEYTSFIDNISDYNHIPFAWSSYGCGGSMYEWLENIGTTPCIQEENQFDFSPLGYDASFCDDFCAIEFIQNFAIGSTELDEPSSNSTFDFRGAIQEDSSLFAWIKVCPQDDPICNPVLFQKTSQLEVYPNPALYIATVDFEVKSAQTVNIRVMEMVTGRVLYKAQIQVQEGKQSVNIPTQSWKEGVYNVQIQMNDELLHGKLSVK